MKKLGKKAEVGSNQHNSQDKITNEELAKQLGVSRRIYQYKKQVAKIIPEVQETIGDTKFAEKMMDMVHLSKQPKEVQIEIAKILKANEAKTYNRAYVLANLKLKEIYGAKKLKKIKDELQTGKSIMKFERIKDKLNDICRTVSKDDDLESQDQQEDLELANLLTTQCCLNKVDGLLIIFLKKEI